MVKPNRKTWIYGVRGTNAKIRYPPVIPWIDNTTRDAIIELVFTANSLLIFMHGYGVNDVPQGAPVLIDLASRHPIVLVWGNIQQERPTHMISLIYAKEENP